MTATVNISGTWSEKQRPNNGLDTHADLIHGNRILRVPAVCFVEYHQWTEKLTGEVLTVAVPVIEPGVEADGSDPKGRGKQLMDMLDELRKERGKGSVEDVPRGGEMPGQTAFDFDGAEDDDEPSETRLGPDGPREVPPPSGEELLAAREEAKAAPDNGLSSDVPGPSTPGGVKANGRGKKPTADPFKPGGAE